jgi:hypothetical protein
MKFPPHLLMAPVLSTVLAYAAQCEEVLMSRYTFNFPMPGDHGRTSGRLNYSHDADKHPGPAGLTPYLPSKYNIQRDEDGIIRKVTSVPYQLSVRPSDEKWTTGDPHAFSVVYGYSPDGPAIRTTTVARIQANGVPVMVSKSVFHGFRESDDRVVEIQPGETTRHEFTSPEPGLGILTLGRETDGEFLAETRNTLIKFRNSSELRLHRILVERLSPETNQWVKVSDQLKEWKHLAGQWRETRVVDDPDGKSVTEEWEYYSHGERTGPDGHTSDGARLKRHLWKDGTEVRHQYLQNGTIKETRRQDGSVRLFTELTVKVDEDTSVRTATETIDGVEVSKVVKEFSPARHVFTTSVPDRPDQVLIRDYYPEGHEFAGTERRIFHPDGTLKTIERIKLEDGNSKFIEEYGTHDGERVIEGERTTIIFGDRPDSGKTTERIDRR